MDLASALPALVPALCALAEAAGQAIADIEARLDPAAAQLPDKADHTPVTLADLAAHRVIAQGLAALPLALPLVSEEDSASHRHALPDAFWLVDPLDGTREFMARNGEYTVNIALVQHGVPIWGVVHAPALHQTFWGGAGLGAMGRTAAGLAPLAVAPVPTGLQPWRVLASRHHLDARTAALIQRLPAHALLQVGRSLKFCRIAQGLADLYPRFGPTSAWDTAAAQAVLEGAGGSVCDLQGAPLRCQGGDWRNPAFVASASPSGLSLASD